MGYCIQEKKVDRLRHGRDFQNTYFFFFPANDENAQSKTKTKKNNTARSYGQGCWAYRHGQSVPADETRLEQIIGREVKLNLDRVNQGTRVGFFISAPVRVHSTPMRVVCIGHEILGRTIGAAVLPRVESG